jgi:quinol---cytochrome c reductase cytochrome c subunit, bacillus type
VNAREKEQYLREYSILKSQGKPFFPYAVAKDGAMAIVTMAVIILMAVLFGAELGPKADPTTTTYSPRPEWYFFFLFELLRVVKPPALVFVATIGIPTIALMLLLLLPFYDRNPERHPMKRPIAMIGAVATVAAMTYLTVLGAIAGPPSEIDIEVAPQYQRGADVVAASGCLGCHKIGENGNTLGPNLTEIGDRLGRDAIARTLVNPTAPMPSYQSLKDTEPKQFDEMVNFVASLRAENEDSEPSGGGESESK